MPVYLLALAESDDSTDGALGDGTSWPVCRPEARAGVHHKPLHRWHGERLAEAARRIPGAAFAASEHGRLYREKAATRLAQQRKVLGFDTAVPCRRNRPPDQHPAAQSPSYRAIAAADAGELLDKVERPSTCFDEVIGADTAKNELKFFIDS